MLDCHGQSVSALGYVSPVSIDWPDEVDEILGGDAAAAFVYMTPAKGAVISPMAPIGQRDREAGTVTVSTSQGLWKKLERVRANPNVAIAYHAREHGFSDRPEFVLVQGRGSFPIEPDQEWLDEIKPEWERFLGKMSTGPVLSRWLEVYYRQRVPITIEVERILVWPDESCAGEPVVHGSPLPSPPPPQRPPKNGTGPRVDAGKLRTQVGKLPHSLLAWAGGDGLPVAVSVKATGSGAAGVDLDVPAIVPPGGRRAGLTAHSFHQHMVGQEQRIHTGWLEASEGRATYSPHTKTGYRLPPSKALFILGAGAGTRAGIGKARARGLAPPR
jgi:hypothetical protein